jgi:cytochrome P450
MGGSTTRTAPRLDVRDYATARAALVHRDLTRSPAVRGAADSLEQHVLNLDGADHRRVRTALDAALAPALPTVTRLLPQLVEQLLDGIDGEVDAAAGFVRPLVLVVLDAVLGLSGDITRWHQIGLALDAGGVPGRAERAAVADLVQARRDEPGDDAVSRLIASDALSERELIATVAFAFAAGYTNTCNFLGLSLLALARHPEQYATLRRDPRAVPQAVEELLRYAEPSGRASLRVAACDTRVNELDITAGTVVLVRRAAAARDPRVVTDGQRLVLDRPAASPALAFGAGRHYCLAAGLVRTLADLTLLGLVRRITRLEATARTPADWDFAQPLWLAMHTTTNTLEES